MYMYNHLPQYKEKLNKLTQYCKATSNKKQNQTHTLTASNIAQLLI